MQRGTVGGGNGTMDSRDPPHEEKRGGELHAVKQKRADVHFSPQTKNQAPFNDPPPQTTTQTLGSKSWPDPPPRLYLLHFRNQLVPPDFTQILHKCLFFFLLHESCSLTAVFKKEKCQGFLSLLREPVYESEI